MTKNEILVKECKNGNKDAYKKLIENNLYIVKHSLNKKKYDKKDEEDLIQEGMFLLVKYIKKYIESDSISISLNGYLLKSLNYRYDKIIKDYNKKRSENIEDLAVCSEDIDYDFISDIENRQLFENLKDFIVRTNYFTFLQKNTLISKGFINEIVLSNSDLARAFNVSHNNFYLKVMDAILKLKRVYASKIYEDKDKYERKDDLFSFMETSKEIVLYAMKCLNKREIILIKMIWGNDFSSLKNLKEVNFSEEEVIEYYNAIGKLYREIQNLSDDEINKNVEFKTDSYHRIIY